MNHQLESFDYSQCKGIVLTKEELSTIAIANGLELDPQPLETIELLPHIKVTKNILSLLVGKGGSGKTFIALQMGINFILKEQKKVLFIMLEDSKIVASTRLKGLIQELKTEQQSLIYASLKVICIDSSEYQSTRAVLQNSDNQQGKKIAELFHPYDLIIIDPLVTIAPLETETKNTIAGDFINYYHKLATHLEKNIIMLHHSTKGSNNNENKSGLVRGSSAISDQARSILALTSALDLDTITQHNSDKNSLTLTNRNRLKQQAINTILKQGHIACINELSTLKNSYGNTHGELRYTMENGIIKVASQEYINMISTKIHAEYENLINMALNYENKSQSPQQKLKIKLD